LKPSLRMLPWDLGYKRWSPKNVESLGYPRNGTADFKVRGTKQDSRAERAIKNFCTPHFSKCGATSKQISVGAYWIYWNLLSGCRINKHRQAYGIMNQGRGGSRNLRRGGAQLSPPSFPLLFFFPSSSLSSLLHIPFRPLPLPLEVGPLNPARGSVGALWAPPLGSGAEPRPLKQFWHIWSPGKASGGKDLGYSCAIIFSKTCHNGCKYSIECFLKCDRCTLCETHEAKELETVTIFTIPNGYSGIDTMYSIVSEQTIIPCVLVQVPRLSPELFGKGVMTMTLCYNNRPPTLSLISVIYNSLGQNKSKELELWPNNEYEIRPYSFQKISSGPTDSDYKIRDGSRFIEWGLASEGVWGIEMAQPPVHFWTVNWLGLRKKGACQVRLPLNPPLQGKWQFSYG